MKRAALSAGGIVLTPPVERERAAAIFRQDVPETAWRRIEEAFCRYGVALDNLRASKSSAKKDDPQSWRVRQAAVVRALEGALKQIESASYPRHGRVSAGSFGCIFPRQRLIPLMPGLLHLVGRCLRGGCRSFVAGTCE